LAEFSCPLICFELRMVSALAFGRFLFLWKLVEVSCESVNYPRACTKQTLSRSSDLLCWFLHMMVVDLLLQRFSQNDFVPFFRAR